MGLLCAVFLVLVVGGKLKLQFPVAARDRVSAGDLMLLLLPMAPVTQYVLNNDDLLAWWEALLVLALFALLVAVPVILVPALLTKTGATRPTMYLGVAFAFMLTSMASLSKQFAWHEWGSLKIQLPILGGIWLFAWLMFRLKARDLMHVAIAVYFAANAMLQDQPRADTTSSQNVAPLNDTLVALIGSRTPLSAPDIYLLVYEAYAPGETMTAYGIDNRDQQQYLEERNFKIYPETYSVAGKTAISMGRVLNASLSLGRETRTAISGNGLVQNLLKGFGYQTYGVFPSEYFFRGVVPSYDYSYPGYGPSAGVLIEAILEGEFRFDVGVEDGSWDEFVREKRRILADKSEAPKFLYAHSNSPGHSPLTGTCRPNEVELYGERLAKANLEMREDIELVLEQDPTAIVIVAGDHGPYLTKNCLGTGGVYEMSEITRLDVQDRLGTFLAIRWPTEEFEDYDVITVLQDLFPAVFAYLFADRGLLEAEVEPASVDKENVSGVRVVDGVILGGVDDGQALFTSGAVR